MVGNPVSGVELFALRLRQLVHRSPYVTAWQIGNEPNIPSTWAPRENPDTYGRLVGKTAVLLPGDRFKVLGGMAYFSEMPLHG